jgi:hypothetical protein
MESRQDFSFSLKKKEEEKRVKKNELVRTLPRVSIDQVGWRARTCCRADVMRPRVYKEIWVYLFMNAVG